ncbi:hypothetical protein [Streptomyces sp. MA5143a]|uniref:hypothetical protein n=1 Tax=Streptomyces sp. MA5143a TaxID=2083010 RepID=UPI000D28589D|nr:hypothetical protein [Streptomyces sp. MA5143a]SPF06710.1 hypothetical protein SMA5143A_7550 [Streptomyces sp. MA5143a]
MHSAILRPTNPTATDTPKSADACCGTNACAYCPSGKTSADPALTVAEAKTASGCGCQK